MANTQTYSSVFIDYTLQPQSGSHPIPRASTVQIEGRIDGGDVVQGKVFWLRSKEELPERAVRRAHGKGAVEEGIYNHPVVVISRPSNEGHMVHFHLITSLQGKKLDQLYNKSNEFHASRRSWYLSIAPTPEHPDANSKKTKKRFPTLLLADSAVLRWDSYVNIRHVYKIELSLLRPYANPETPNTEPFRFERESIVRLLAKSKILTMYEPGPQYQSPVLKRSQSEPLPTRIYATRPVEENTQRARSPVSDTASIMSKVYSVTDSPPWSDFRVSAIENTRITGPPPKVPPDMKVKTASVFLYPHSFRHPLDRIVEDFKHTFASVGPKSVSVSFDVKLTAQSLDHFWVNVKGVTAVIIASI